MPAVSAYHGAASGQRAYHLTSAQMHELVGSLLVEHPAPDTARFVGYRVADTSRYSDVARSIERTVFESFFGNTADEMREAYGRYEAHSQFLLVVDREQQQPAGTLRIIEYSAYGLKTLNDIQAEPLSLSLYEVLDYHQITSLERCWDVGTLAVLKSYRGASGGHFVGTMLYGLFHAAALREGIEHAVAVLDRHAYRQLTEMLAVPFEPIVGSSPFNYLGSTGSRAAYVRIPSVRPTVEGHMDRLDGETRTSLRPFVTRVIYAEGLPELVDVR